MPIRFQEQIIEAEPDSTVLDTLLSAGIEVPWFCKNGSCQSCLLRASSGSVPAVAQAGLRAAMREQGYFLSCQARLTSAEEVLSVERGLVLPLLEARVLCTEVVAPAVVRVNLSVPAGWSWRGGQFVQLVRPSDGLMRPYSVASIPESGVVELHVTRHPGGKMSGWLEAAEGELVQLRGPFGDCSYVPDEPERTLFLAGTGTGLSPLLGVLRTALARGHRGRVRVFHASRYESGLYAWPELQALVAERPELQVFGCAPEGNSRLVQDRLEVRAERLEPAVLAAAQGQAAARFYLCGNPATVRLLRKKLYLSGVALDRIHLDAFEPPGSAGACN
jgi:CDP-4-dehydro-6-deoxyglucose reductase, E3